MKWKDTSYAKLYIGKTDITNFSGLFSFTDCSEYIMNSQNDKYDFFLSLSGLKDILERVPQRMMWVT